MSEIQLDFAPGACSRVSAVCLYEANVSFTPRRVRMVKFPDATRWRDGGLSTKMRLSRGSLMQLRFSNWWSLVACLAYAAPAVAQRSAGQALDDSTINASVKADLIGNRTTRARDINVETYKGVVQLSGFVASDAEKLEAGRIAAGVSGVEGVRNDLELAAATSMGQKLDDSVTTSRVKAALIDAREVKSGQINVETRAGVVQLSGFVATEAMKTRAGQVAARVDGVGSVSNALLVRPD